MKVLIIELGIKNIEIAKSKFKDNEYVLFAQTISIAIDIILKNKDIHIIMISDFKGNETTIGYIKMLRTTNPHFKIIIISNEKFVNDDNLASYIKAGADNYYSIYDLEKINLTIYNFIQKEHKYKDYLIDDKWRKCTKETLRYLKEHYSNFYDDILKKLSKITSYSKSTISHYVKEDTGKTVLEWLVYYKIISSIQLLKSTNFTIDYIAKQVGYSTPQGFIKAFKKSIGINPTKYRKESFF